MTLTREEVLEQYRNGCSFLSYGHCSTVACLHRAGYVSGPTAGFQPTCPEREAIEASNLRAQLAQVTVDVKDREDQIFRLQEELEEAAKLRLLLQAAIKSWQKAYPQDVLATGGFENKMVHQLAEREATIEKLQQSKRIADALMLEGSQKIDELRVTVARLEQEHSNMLQHFTAMRIAAGGYDDTIEEAVKRVTTLTQRVLELEGPK